MSFLHRFVLWLIVCGLIAVQVLGLSYLLRRYTPLHSDYLGLLSRAIAMVLTICLVAVQLHALKFTPVLPKQVDPPLEFLAFVALPVAVIGSMFLLLQYLLQQSVSEPTSNSLTDSKKQNGDESSKLRSSTPEWRRTKTLRIQVEDHYLRVINEDENFYIRGKISEAIKLLHCDEGVQTHRSHWVSYDYVKQLVKHGRDYRLMLKDESSVPVSRGRLTRVRNRLKKYNG